MKAFVFICLSFCFCSLQAQESLVLLKEAENLERSLKENEALDKYKQVLTLEPNNVKALVKAAELSCAIGARIENKNDKRLQYESALAFAKRAISSDVNNADANYAMAMASGKMTEIETENKKIVAFVKDTKLFADKALAINPNHGKANFTLGRWHYEMVNLAGYKKTAVKLLYGGLPAAELDSAIIYMEKCKQYEPYFMLNYYYLNKAYKENNRPAKQIEVLSKMSKLPVRTADDATMKAEAVKELQSLQ